MTQLIKLLLFLFTTILIVSIVGYCYGDSLYSPLLCFIACNGLVYTCIGVHLKKTSSGKQFGMYLLGIVSLLTFYNYDSHWGTTSILYMTMDQLDYSIRSVFTLLLIVYALHKVIVGGQINLLIKKKHFWFTVLILILYLVISAPLYHVHGDCGGYQHGHYYLKGLHYH